MVNAYGFFKVVNWIKVERNYVKLEYKFQIIFRFVTAIIIDT
jgi:hypothetical protein